MNNLYSQSDADSQAETLCQETRVDVAKKNEEKPLMVSIRCITYNHEKYIREALEGFVMQQTNFRFEAVVHDDASTDGTAAIIREFETRYPDIIKPIYETENQYSKADGSLGRIMAENMRGKYVAYCEGDDYWTDPLKLQKQVDYMESHPECGLCYTKALRYNQSTGKMGNEFGRKIMSFQDMLLQGEIPTLSVLLKRSIREQYDKDIPREERQWPMGDYPQWLYFAANSKIYFIPTVTGVYRILQSSASHNTDKNKVFDFERISRKIALFFNEKYNGGLESEIQATIYWTDFIQALYNSNFSKATESQKRLLRNISLLSFKRKIAIYLFSVSKELCRHLFLKLNGITNY